MEHKEKKSQANKGITLIALVVTNVVLIILATVSINAVLGQNGIIKKAKQAKELYSNSIAKDNEEMDRLLNEMAQYDTDNSGSGGGTTKPEEGITVTVDGTEGIKLTKANVANYLGKVVTNYVPTTSSVTIESMEYNVSTKYRLYYVDFDGKYGEKNGVYLKADCTSNNYLLPIPDATASTANNVKIRALNPSLYASGVTSPVADNTNMLEVTWLTNTSNWDSLKTGSSLANKVNYVVGAPSVEMMMDSYNTKYNLTESTPNTGTLTADTARAKLFYQYPTTVDSNNYGYELGPCHYNGTEYDYYTSNYSVKTDSAIDSMYYPGDNQYYWLASPSAYGDDIVLFVFCYNGGYVSSDNPGNAYLGALCPLVSLQSTVSLQLQ